MLLWEVQVHNPKMALGMVEEEVPAFGWVVQLLQQMDKAEYSSPLGMRLDERLMDNLLLLDVFTWILLVNLSSTSASTRRQGS
jgi:hypothetical protein